MLIFFGSRLWLSRLVVVKIVVSYSFFAMTFLTVSFCKSFWKEHLNEKYIKKNNCYVYDIYYAFWQYCVSVGSWIHWFLFGSYLFRRIGYSILSSLSNALPITTSYKRLAYCSTSGSGFNCNLKVRCELNGISNRGVIMMKGKSGNILWTASSDNYVPSHGSYTFWCGSDVYSIWIKTTSGYGNAWIER